MGRLRLGDISNHTAPIVAFNVDNILFKPKEKLNFMEKVNRFLQTDRDYYDYFSREISLNGIYMINNCWTKNEVSIYLLTFTEYYRDIESILYDNDVYYSRLVSAQGIDWLRRKCRFTYAYYFDTNDALISELSVDNAQKLVDIYKFLKV